MLATTFPDLLLWSNEYARWCIEDSALTVQQEAVNPIYLLAWIPETLLSEKGTAEWDKFVQVEEHPVTDDDDGACRCLC